MFHKSRAVRTKTGHLMGVAALVCLLFGLLMSLVTSAASASADRVSLQDGPGNLAVQNTATPTATLQTTLAPTTTSGETPRPTSTLLVGSQPTFSVSLAELGYDEIVLDSPYDQFQYTFRLPENWAIQSDGVLDLDLSYLYEQVDGRESPPLFGELVAKLDGQTLDVLPIGNAKLENLRWSVALPASLLDNPDRMRHVLELTFDAGLLCDIPHKARLTIHPTSSILLTYELRSLVLDLGHYPRPFYQQAFEPDLVRFVLPSQPTASDLSNAVAVAAKLGDLTGGSVVISATAASDLIGLIGSSSDVFGAHLIVIGRPQDNQLLSVLNEEADLPARLYQGQVALTLQGPATIAPGEVFTYTFTVTNTTGQAVDLSLVDPLPPDTDFVACTGGCVKTDEDRSITWNDSRLVPDEGIDLSLTLVASDVLTGDLVENVVTVNDAGLGPLNAGTLTSTVVTTPGTGELRSVVLDQENYFFVYDGRAVAEGDGLVQEILSPWNENRAVLIITGLSDEAVRKASQAMSSETRFPGMNGPLALVQSALTRAEINEATPPVVEMTLADLGYSDQVVRGGGTIKQVDYFFRVPYGWQLTEDAAIDIYFSHSGRIDYQNSGLTASLNRQPIASTALSEESATDGHLHISLADATVRRGDLNRLTLEVDMAMQGVCTDDDQAWFRIKNSSRIFFAHREDAGLDLNFSFFPHPFHLNPALTDVAFVLPEISTADDWESALRLAASLGDSASGKTIAPVVMLDSDLTALDSESFQLIALGRPSRNRVIQQVNADLPQPFLPGTDEIKQKLDDVVFRLPRGVDLGYLQLIPSPWDATRAFLAVTGTSEKSIKWAVDVLVSQPWALGSGNLALVREAEINTIDTRVLTRAGLAAAVTTAVPEMTETATETPAATATNTSALSSSGPTPDVTATGQAWGTTRRPAWLVPLIGITGLVVLAIFAVALWQARRERL